MIFVECSDNREERRFLDSEVAMAVGTFNALRVKADMNYVSIKWLKDNWLECKQTRLPGTLIKVQEVLDKISELECEHE